MNTMHLRFILLPLLMISVAGCNTAAIPETYKGGNKYSVYQSPQGDFSIVMYRIPMAFAMPGGASDAPGIVCLFDSHGAILKEKKIEMVQLLNEPVWTDGKVYIKLFAEWELE